MPRTIGVEEELLVVDQRSGRSLAVAASVIGHAARAVAESEHLFLPSTGPGGSLTAEFKRQQLETDTPPRTELAHVEHDLRRWRGVAAAAARHMGARVIASGTSPDVVHPQVVRSDRYQAMVERFGLTGREHLTCGCHVHVAVESDDEGVVALNGTRIWLPALLALSTNSPFWQGQDSGYASFRTQVMGRWPATGPSDLYASGLEYRSAVRAMIGTGVVRDAAMVYFDARLSARYPTLEIRVADVCQDVRDTALLAALSRALVDTSVAQAEAGIPVARVPTRMVRLATWQASKEGLDGLLLDPYTCAARPAPDVVAALLDHVRPALEAAGDLERVNARLEEILTSGSGARRQRAVMARTHRMADVVADLARVTAGLD